MLLRLLRAITSLIAKENAAFLTKLFVDIYVYNMIYFLCDKIGIGSADPAKKSDEIRHGKQKISILYFDRIVLCRSQQLTKGDPVFF